MINGLLKARLKRSDSTSFSFDLNTEFSHLELFQLESELFVGDTRNLPLGERKWMVAD